MIARTLFPVLSEESLVGSDPLSVSEVGRYRPASIY